MKTSPQMSLLEEAVKRRDEGMRRALKHADGVLMSWSERAMRSVKDFLLTEGAAKAFTAEEIREWAKLVEPPDRRAWGGVLTHAARAGLIKKVGYRPHRDPSRHNAPSTVWHRA